MTTKGARPIAACSSGVSRDARETKKNERDLPCPRGWIGLIVQPGTARSGFAAGMMHQSRAMRWMSAALEFWDNRIKSCGSPEKRCQLERWWIKFSLVVESWLQSSPIPILKQTHQNIPKAGVHMFLFRDIFRITTVCSSQRWFKLLRWVLAADIAPEVPEAVAEDDDMIWQPWWLESGLVMSKPNCFKLLQDLLFLFSSYYRRAKVCLAWNSFQFTTC